MLLKYRSIFFSFAIIVFVVLVIFVVRFFNGPEDQWLCVNGEWLAHGNPAETKPTTGCEPITAESVSYVDTIGERCDSVPRALFFEREQTSSLTVANSLLRQWLNFYLNPDTCLSQKISAFTIDDVVITSSRPTYITAKVTYSVRPAVAPSKYWSIKGTTTVEGWVTIKGVLDIGRGGGKDVLKDILYQKLQETVASTTSISTSTIDSIQ